MNKDIYEKIATSVQEGGFFLCQMDGANQREKVPNDI